MKKNYSLKKYLPNILVLIVLILFVGCGNSNQTSTSGVDTTQNLTSDSDSLSNQSTATSEDNSSDGEFESTTTEVSSTEMSSAETSDDKKVIKFMAVGDNLIHTNLYDGADLLAGVKGDGLYDFSNLFEGIKDAIQSADIRFINQETISGGDELGISSYPSFNSPRQLIKDVEAAGFNLVNLANNHALDMGIRGIYHSLYNWSKTDCVTSGIFGDIEDRNNIRIFEIDGVKFAFLTYTSHTNGISPDFPWRVSYLKEEEIIRDIAEAKKLSDFIIVSSHWGWDDVFTIDDNMNKFADLFTELDVDLVVGTGPHVIHPIHWKEHGEHKTLVAFSLGNYASGMIGAFNDLTGILKLNFVIDSNGKRIEDVVFDPLVFHKDIDDTKFGIFYLRDYTDELANTHYSRQYTSDLNVGYFYDLLKRQISPEFLPEEYR